MSWYGANLVPMPLGEAFHARRLTIRSSQVGSRRRVAARALGHAAADGRSRCRCSPIRRSTSLITGESEFETLPHVMAQLAANPGDTLCHRIRYSKSAMYTVTVRDHFMIAHSFRGEAFGPAQRLHGATYVVDVEFRRARPRRDGMVVDIGRAGEVLRATLAEIELSQPRRRAGVHRAATRRPSFWRRSCSIASSRRSAAASSEAARAPSTSMRVTLHESHVASAGVRRTRERGALIVAGERAGLPLTFVVPGDLETRTGGYGYDRRIIAGLRERGWSRRRGVARRLSFPFPTSGRARASRRALAAIPDGATVLVDGLALGALPDEVGAGAASGCVSSRSSTIRWPLETGLDPARGSCPSKTASGARWPPSGRRGRHRRVNGCGAGALRRRRERIAVVEPGTDRAPLARGSSRPAGAERRRTGAAVRRDADAAQGPRHAVSRAGGDSASALAADMRRQPRSRSRTGRSADARCCDASGLEDRVELLGDLDAAALGGRIRPRRSVRAVDAVRGLRDGGGRGAGAWAAGGQHSDGQHPGAGRRRGRALSSRLAIRPRSPPPSTRVAADPALRARLRGRSATASASACRRGPRASR